MDEKRLDLLSRGLYDYFGTTEPWILNTSAASVLSELKRRGHKLAILSNFDSQLRSLLSDFDLDRYFDFRFLSGETGLAKSDVAAFRLVEAVSELKSHSIAHVGDDIDLDYEAAKSAGWRSFLFLPPGYSRMLSDVDPSDVVHDLMHLLNCID